MARPDRGAEPLLSIAEFERLPEEDAYRVELVRGRLVRSPRPAALHGRLVTRLVYRLEAHVEPSGQGVVLTDPGVVLSRDPDTVRGPDIAYFSRERIPPGAYATAFWGPPDLAVEVTSPSNRASHVQEKVMDYLDAGVLAVWVVNAPTRSITVYRPGGEARVLRGDDVLEGGEVLPGFRLALAALFSL